MSMRVANKTLLAAIAAAGVATTAASLAIGWSCVARAPQRARLELVSVTVDGVPQTDLIAYRDLQIDVSAPYVGTITSPPGAQFTALKHNGRYLYIERFDDPMMRDR